MERDTRAMECREDEIGSIGRVTFVTTFAYCDTGKLVLLFMVSKFQKVVITTKDRDNRVISLCSIDNRYLKFSIC